MKWWWSIEELCVESNNNDDIKHEKILHWDVDCVSWLKRIVALKRCSSWYSLHPEGLRRAMNSSNSDGSQILERNLTFSLRFSIISKVADQRFVFGTSKRWNRENEQVEQVVAWSPIEPLFLHKISRYWTSHLLPMRSNHWKCWGHHYLSCALSRTNILISISMWPSIRPSSDKHDSLITGRQMGDLTTDKDHEKRCSSSSTNCY
jgi:hypothetical protein